MFLLLAVMYLFNAWRFAYPAGYAGLYTLMAEILSLKPFPLPAQVPFYGPGGIPFAYPPAALYLAALFIGPLHIPAFTYLRWEPALVCILAMIAVYLLGRRLFGDRVKALVGVVVVFSAETVYSYHATASGSVRGLALLWTVLAAYFTLRAFSPGVHRIANAAIAGMFVALTVMTHLAYVAFLVPGIVLMTLLSREGSTILDRGRNLGVVALVGAVLSAPWWGTMLLRYGPAVFLNAGSTHGTLGILAGVSSDPLGVLRAILRWYVNLGGTWWPHSLMGLAIAGFAYAIARGRWLLPAWTIVAVATLGQTDRFEILLAGLLAGELLVDVARFVGHGAPTAASVGQETLGGLVFLAFALIPVMVLGFRGIQWTDVALSDDLVGVGSWLRTNSSESSRYLYLGGDHDTGEWLPYLARRTPGVSPWGAEWTGNYDEQQRLTEELSTCVGGQQPGCLDGFIASVGGNINWLIVPGDQAQLGPIVSDPLEWQLAYQNGGFSVFERKN